MKIKKLKDFTYKDISNYCNYLWHCSTEGFTVIAIYEFLKQAPKFRKERWWQKHKFELLNKNNLDKEVNLETWEFSKEELENGDK